MIDRAHRSVSVARQCDLLGLARSTLYYAPVADDPEDLEIMRLLDEQYTRTPFYGVRRMTHWLRGESHGVNPKRVRRLLRMMGLEAVYPKPHLSQATPGHRIYPYLLRGMTIQRPNQVWSTDITYIRLARGFVYLAAILDWFSRYVLAWSVSNTLDSLFCVEALRQALAAYGPPEIFNSDQGVQFTAEAFTGTLVSAGVAISMDGRGRALDNVFVERLWRTVKYEEVYLKDYAGVPSAVTGLGAYFGFYNAERPHQALGYQTPQAVYLGLARAEPTILCLQS
jgi:putative transposase